MKRTCFLIFCLFIAIAFKATAQDFVLLPEKFYLHKGDKLELHFITANQFIKQDELKYEASKTAQFMLYGGSKKTDMNLTTVAKDSAAPIVSVAMVNEGLNLVSMVQKSSTEDIERDDFLKILDDDGFYQFSEKAKNGSKDSFREKSTWFLKSLVQVDDNSANNFNKPLNEEYEIILKDNPYRGNYGADLTALVRLKGKPIANASVILYVKTLSGGIFAQKLSTDKDGQVYFKLSREGIYLLRSIYMEASKDKNADFDTWISSYTFAFNSSNEMPNTYKEFGFGNKH
jgi:uncharacterized GH25 family protein